jgi:hypothetical protein
MQKSTVLYRNDESNEPTKEGTLSFVLFESPFTSVLKSAGAIIKGLAHDTTLGRAKNTDLSVSQPV